MASLNTVFKKVYAEALEPYGFKKIKGRQPYFVRMVGDEIVHVITVIPEPIIMPGVKRYGIYGGVATVYRPQINFNISPRENRNWLISNFQIYRDIDVFTDKTEESIEKNIYSYEADNEESLLKSMKNSVDATKMYLLRELSKVNNLSRCVEYYEFFHSRVVLYFNQDKTMLGDFEYYEGLINFKAFSVEDYINHTKKYLAETSKRIVYMIEKGMVGGTIDSFKEEEKELIKSAEKRIAIFDKYVNDEKLYMMVLGELESRKTINIEILQKYNVI